MRWIVTKLNRVGEYLTGLSNRARLQLVAVLLFLLLGFAVRKLVVSLNKLDQAPPVATPDQLLKPMEELVKQGKGQYGQYKSNYTRQLEHLDSLAETINPALKPINP